MATNFLKILLVIFTFSLMQSCPAIGEEVCDDLGSSAHIDNLITITPLKQTYSQGEEVIYKIIIPSENNYFGNAVNLFQKTSVNDAWYIASSTNLFDQNLVTYMKGSKRSGAENWHNVTYNSITKNYELEIKIKLNRIGNYSMFCQDRIDFLGSTKCNRYFIYTTIAGNQNGFINFTVQ